MGLKLNTEAFDNLRHSAGNVIQTVFTKPKRDRWGDITRGRSLRLWPTALSAVAVASAGGISLSSYDNAREASALQTLVNNTKVELVSLPETNGQPTIRAVFAGARYTLLGSNTIERIEANTRYEFNLETARAVESRVNGSSASVNIENISGPYAAAAHSAKLELCALTHRPTARQSEVAMNYQRKYC